MTLLETIHELYRAMREGDDAAFTPEEFVEAEDRVMVLGHYSGTQPQTGKAMRAAVAHVYDFRAGKVCRFRMYADTQPMWAAMI